MDRITLRLPWKLTPSVCQFTLFAFLYDGDHKCFDSDFIFKFCNVSTIQYLLHISELLFHSSSRGGLVFGSCDVFSGGWDDMGAAAWIKSKQSLNLGWELYQVICNEQCSLDTSDNYIIRYQSSPKVNYYSDFDFHLKSFNHFINDAELPTNRNKYFEDHMDPISFHLCAAWMTLTPFSHQRLTDTFRCALPEVVGGAS